MTEVVGDYLEPSELRLPVLEGTNQPTYKGAIFISGAKLYFYNGSAVELVTSA